MFWVEIGILLFQMDFCIKTCLYISYRLQKIKNKSKKKIKINKKICLFTYKNTKNTTKNN